MKKNYYDYEIYDNGTIIGKRFKRPLKSRINEYGYPEVTLYLDNKKIKIAVHRVIALLFCEGYEEGLQVNHKDGNKLNNNFYNFEWVTTQENIKHAYKTGLNNRMHIINSQKRRKLKLEQVRDIRKRHSQGESLKSIYEDYKNIIRYSTFYDIVRYKHFRKEIEDEKI